MVMHPSKQT